MRGVRNMMAGTPHAPSVATKRRCSPPAPTHERLLMQTPRAASSGFLLPWPKGWSISRASMVGTVSSSSPTTAAISSCETNWSAGSSDTTSPRRSRKSSRFSASMVTPTAPACPPKRSVRSAHCSTAWKRSTDPTERPEPRATPSEMVKRMAGTP